jgi:tetratricopeptide (TPR) repeat protein
LFELKFHIVKFFLVRKFGFLMARFRLLLLNEHFVMKKILLILLLHLFVPLLYGQSESIPEKIQTAISSLNAGDKDRAAAILQEVIQLQPQHGPARLLLAQISLEQNDWVKAEEHLKIAVASNVRRSHIAWQLLGKLQLSQHRYEEARTSFDQALSQAADFTPALFARAQSELFLNDTDSAITDLQNAKSPDAILLLAQVLRYSNRTVEAKEQLNAFQFQDAQQAAVAKLFLLALSEDRSAENELKSYISDNLGDSNGYVALAMWQQKPDLTLYEIAFQLNDQNPVPLLFLKKRMQQVAPPKTPLPEIVSKINAAGAALKEGNLKEAKTLADSILHERPLHYPAELILIESAEKESDYWNALDRYNRMLKKIPGIPGIESRAAVLAEKMTAYDLAECHARTALLIEPQNGYLHYVLASILYAQKNIDEGMKEAERAIDLGFQSAAVYVLLGNLHFEKAEISKSIAALKTAVEKDPHAAENIGAFALATLTAEDYQALQEALEAHAKANPENTGTLYSLAQMYMNENELDRAKEYLIQLQNTAPDHLQVHYNLGLLYFRLGEEEAGKKAMARFQQLKQKELEDWTRHNHGFKIRMEAKDAMSKKNAEESIRLYSQLVTEKLAETEDWLALANAYVLLKEHKKALDAYLGALKISPYNREALAGAAQSSSALRQKDEAELYNHRFELISKPCS